MIDLHSHILPGIDDGAKDLGISLEMARACVIGGVEVMACTPHIIPGVYANTGPQIREAVANLQGQLDASCIALKLVPGSDAHMVPDMVAGLRSKRILSLADSRYVLVEPPHHIQPVNIHEFFFQLMLAGYQPILTHPERLSWIENNYHTITKLTESGVWMQITAGSLIGAFGRRPLYWAERMLDEGRVHIMASDAHGAHGRPPNLGQGRDVAAQRVGEQEATHLVLTRPLGILNDESPNSLPAPNPVFGADSKFTRNAVRKRAEFDNFREGKLTLRNGFRRLVDGVQRLIR